MYKFRSNAEYQTNKIHFIYFPRNLLFLSMKIQFLFENTNISALAAGAAEKS